MQIPSSGMSEPMFQALVEQTLAGIYIIQNGQFQYVNPQFAAMFGFSSPEEIINTVPIIQLIADRDVAMVTENVRRRTLGQVKDMRYRFMAKRKDGSHFHVEVHGKSSTYNDQPAVVGVLIDVTEQVAAEQRLSERDSKIRALYSGNVIGILCWSDSGFIHDANPVFRQMVGLTDADFAGAGLDWKSITPPEYYDICTEHVMHILTHGRGVPVQKEYLSRSGERIPVLVNGVLLGDDSGAGISFVLDLRNVRHIESERDMLAEMVERAPALMFVQDMEGKIVYVNEAAECKGKRYGGLMGKTEFDFMEHETAQRVAADRQRILKKGGLEQYEEVIRYPQSDEPAYFRTTKWPLKDANDHPIGLAGIVVDITGQKKVEAELTRYQNLINAVFENMPLLAVLKDVEGRIISFNGLFGEIYGLKAKDAIGKFVWEVLPQVTEAEVRLSHEYVLSTGRPYVAENTLEFDGKSVPYLLNLFPVRDASGEISALCALVQNLEEIKQAKLDRDARQKAEYESLHDGLTGLPNRKLVLDRVEQMLAHAKREKLKFVVCFIDLDRFKEVNDTLGHAAGDELLQVLTRRMSSCIRESDTLARVGGDEFVAVLRGGMESLEIRRVIERLGKTVAKPVTLKQGEVSVSCSIGCAGYPDDGVTIEALMTRSDALMYEQKRRERCIRIDKLEG